jgi:hypothetical protein
MNELDGGLSRRVDTRAKIVGWAEFERAAAGGRFPAVVVGHFDPLLAAHARRLEELAGGGGRVLAVVTSPDRPLLGAQARAELVAALGAVAYVWMAPEQGFEALLARLPREMVVRAETADLELTRELIAHARSRQSA